MSLRTRRRELHGVVGAIGVAVAALGIVGGLYPVMPAIAAAFAIWVVGATLVNVFTNPPR